MVRPGSSFDVPDREREGIVIGWAPLASTAVHLLLILLALFVRDAIHRDPPAPESPPLRVTFEPIPKFQVEPEGSARAPLPGGGGARAKAKAEAPAPPRAERQDRAPEDTNGSRKPDTPALPPRTETNLAPNPLVADSRAPRTGEADPSRGFSVERALRDFRRSLGASHSGGGEGPAGDDGRSGGFGTPDLPPLPPTGFGFGNLQFESRDFDWTDYARQIYVAIWRAWHHRLYLTTDAFEKWSYQQGVLILDHQSGIRFTIQGNGQLSGVAVEAASGCIPLDDSAVAALQEVVLPPLPPDFPREAETVHARFIAQGEVRAMRPTLEYLRSRGFF